MTLEIQVTKAEVDKASDELNEHADYIKRATSLAPTSTDARFHAFADSINAANAQLISRVNDITDSARAFAADVLGLDESAPFNTPVQEYLTSVSAAVHDAGHGLAADIANDIGEAGDNFTDMLNGISARVLSGIAGLEDQANRGIAGIHTLVTSIFDGSALASVNFPPLDGIEDEDIDAVADAAKSILHAINTVTGEGGDISYSSAVEETDIRDTLIPFPHTPPFDPGAGGAFYTDTQGALVYETPDGTFMEVTDYSDTGEAVLRDYAGTSAADGSTSLSSADTSAADVSTTLSSADATPVTTHLSDADSRASFGSVGEVRPAYTGSDTSGMTISKQELAAIIEQAIASEAIETSIGSAVESYAALPTSSNYGFSADAQFYVDGNGNYYVYEPSAAGGMGLADMGSIMGGGSTMSYGDIGLTIGSPVGEAMIDVSQVNYDRPPDGPLGQEQIGATIATAMDALGITDPAAREKWAGVVDYMIEHESGYAPSAGNNWDSNAIGARQVDGLPGQASRGLMQTIPTTFAAHHVSGTSNSIYDPVANVAAAMNYMMVRYGIDAYGNGLDAFYGRRYPTYMGY